MRGKFITLEGMDGAGKSTHIPFILNCLESMGKKVVSTREPGGTELGEVLRNLLLHEKMHPETETLLMFAARREHISQVIEPALSKGVYVLSDRFTDATFAYQSGGRGVSAHKIVELERWVQGNLEPDLTILFDVPVEVSLRRLQNARSPDKFEKENEEFFSKIRNAYIERAKSNPRRFRIVNGDQSIEDIHKILKELIIDL